MGQAISSFRKASPPIAPLLNLPVELVLAISDQLTAKPEALVALSLTCKPLYNLLKERANLQGVHRKNILLLLEKDFGDKVFYCPFCFRLHSFLSSWTPTDWDLRLFNLIPGCPYERCPVRGQAFELANLGKYNLGYHHARLVMNRHLFGMPNGLPLSNLQRYIVDFRAHADTPPWTQRWSAKIIEDELFLSAIHKVVLHDEKIAAFRHFNNFHHFCPHIVTTDRFAPHNLLEEIPELKGSEPEKPDSPFVPCRDVLHSCSLCPTDMKITIERVRVCISPLAEYRNVDRHVLQCWGECGRSKTSHVAGWQITVTAYHQFGSCRSPEDWNWKALAPRHGKRFCMLQRDMAIYPSGAVMQRWQNSN